MNTRGTLFVGLSNIVILFAEIENCPANIVSSHRRFVLLYYEERKGGEGTIVSEKEGTVRRGVKIHLGKIC